MTGRVSGLVMMDEGRGREVNEWGSTGSLTRGASSELE